MLDWATAQDPAIGKAPINSGSRGSKIQNAGGDEIAQAAKKKLKVWNMTDLVDKNLHSWKTNMTLENANLK